jgi:hypothetical protein
VEKGPKYVTAQLATLAASRVQHESRIRELEEKLTSSSGFDRRKLEAKVRLWVLRIDEIDRKASRLREV